MMDGQDRLRTIDVSAPDVLGTTYCVPCFLLEERKDYARFIQGGQGVCERHLEVTP